MTDGHTLSPKNLTPILDPLHFSLRNSKLFPNPKWAWEKPTQKVSFDLKPPTTNLVDPEFSKSSTHNLVVMALVGSESILESL
jgi:hypothetical protein